MKKPISLLFILAVLSSCNRPIDFLITSDLHYNATPKHLTIMDSSILIMNNIPEIPLPGSEKKNLNPFAVFIPGDITDSGIEEEWDLFTSDFGINGKNKLKFPVYESFGNHDGNIGGVVRNSIRERNLNRDIKCFISPDSLHYSFNHKGVHFAMLGSYPGNEWDPNCDWCHYFKETFRDAEMSLAFLEDDLKNNLEREDQPVVLFFHYGWDGFSMLWWTLAEQENFYKVIKDKNILGIFHGHNHGIDHYKWKGIDVWSDGSPQRENGVGSFLGARIQGDSLSVYAFENNNWRRVKNDELDKPD